MRWQVGGDTTTVTYGYAYRCHGCSALVPQGQINWPDVCDHCYWRANLSANLAAAGMAAVLHRLLVRSCMNGDCDCSSGRMQRTMREAVS